MPTEGELINGKYRLIRRIARGGMGEVWKARNEFTERYQRHCAVKFILGDQVARPHLAERFAREALTGYTLASEHPNLVTTYDLGESHHGLFMVTQFVDGPTLHQARAKLGRDYPMLRSIAQSVMFGLFELHQHGIIHRDVSPANILIGRSGLIKLADLGLLKRLGSEPSATICGTVAYVSPEQMARNRAMPQSDLYSLGAVLYQLVTGHPPYGDESIVDVYFRMRRGSPAPLPADLPLDLTALILGLLEKDPSKRLQADQGLALIRHHGEPTARRCDVAAFAEDWLTAWVASENSKSKSGNTPSRLGSPIDLRPMRSPGPPLDVQPLEEATTDLYVAPAGQEAPEETIEIEVDVLPSHELMFDPERPTDDAVPPDARPPGPQAKPPPKHGTWRLIATAAMLAAIAGYGLWHRSSTPAQRAGDAVDAPSVASGVAAGSTATTGETPRPANVQAESAGQGDDALEVGSTKAEPATGGSHDAVATGLPSTQRPTRIRRSPMRESWTGEGDLRSDVE